MRSWIFGKGGDDRVDRTASQQNDGRQLVGQGSHPTAQGGSSVGVGDGQGSAAAGSSPYVDPTGTQAVSRNSTDQRKPGPQSQRPQRGGQQQDGRGPSRGDSVRGQRQQHQQWGGGGGGGGM
eukprot:CAMPEP_0113547132 /NCGR_PEP_ID=MMETSP0015_2-20120614/12186_1 /TAXON_ID=2838 /ORGANISM="Odontella" /LENGTH=121 /DNA_ID=CAMNT_0000447653 /DNA_START=59 /DNA_END=421 /DNA_ORIENTATION=- /assembly_acc=CAM_ASM_000160